MNISFSLQIQVGNYTLPSLSQCAQKIYEPLSRFKENFTIEKIKSFFEPKIREVKSSDGVYYEEKDFSIMAKTIEFVFVVGLTVTLFSILIWGLGIKIVLASFIGTLLLIGVIALFSKLIDIFFIGSEESEKAHNPYENRTTFA